MTGDKPDERLRTPMAWTGKLPNVGFSGVAPWEAAADGSDRANVASETADPDSVLAAYRDLIALRTLYPSLGGAETVIVPSSARGMYAIVRHVGDETTMVVVNFGLKAENASFDLSGVPCVTPGTKALAIYGGVEEVAPVTDPGSYVPLAEMAPYQTLIVKLGGEE